MPRKSGLSTTGSRSAASCRLIFHSAGWRVARLMYLYIEFIIARAKYAFG